MRAYACNIMCNYACIFACNFTPFIFFVKVICVNMALVEHPIVATTTAIAKNDTETLQRVSDQLYLKPARVHMQIPALLSVSFPEDIIYKVIDQRPNIFLARVRLGKPFCCEVYAQLLQIWQIFQHALSTSIACTITRRVIQTSAPRVSLM